MPKHFLFIIIQDWHYVNFRVTEFWMVKEKKKSNVLLKACFRTHIRAKLDSCSVSKLYSYVHAVRKQGNGSLKSYV